MDKEESLDLALDFDRIASIEARVIPVVAQDADTLQVLIVAHANKAALEHTLKKKLANARQSSNVTRRSRISGVILSNASSRTSKPAPVK